MNLVFALSLISASIATANSAGPPEEDTAVSVERLPFVSAQDAKTEATPVRYMVVTPNTPLKEQDKVLGTLPLGVVVSVTQENAGWLWSSDRAGWIRKEHVIPLKNAVAIFTADIRKKPTAAGYHHRGLAYAALGKQNEAITDYSAAIRLAPRDASLYNNRGNSWRRIGSLDNALKDYDSAITIDAKNAAAYHNRGLLYSDKKQPAKALADFDQAVKLNPNFAAAYNNRGVAHRDLGKLDKAMADYEQALKLNPQFAAAYANRGYIHKSRGKYREAQADYIAALKLIPNLASANNDLAWLLATCPVKSLRDGKTAVTHASKACELTRYRDWNMLDTLSAAYAEAGDFEKATHWAKQAMKAAPENQRPTFRKRLIQFAAKRPVRAN